MFHFYTELCFKGLPRDEAQQFRVDIRRGVCNSAARRIKTKQEGICNVNARQKEMVVMKHGFRCGQQPLRHGGCTNKTETKSLMWVAKSPKWQPLPSLFLHYEESHVDFLWWGLEQQIPKIPFPHIIQYLWKAFEEEGSYWTNRAKATTRSGENRNTGGSFPSSSISREFLNSLSSNHLPVTIS